MLAFLIGCSVYIYIRGFQTFSPLGPLFKYGFITVFFLLVSCFLAGFALQGRMPAFIDKIVTGVGYIWLIAMIYFILLLLATDIVRLSNYLFNWFPPFITENIRNTRVVLALLYTAIIAVALITGNYRFNNPSVMYYHFDGEKFVKSESADSNGFNIVFASDIHLGNAIDGKKLKKIVNLINAQKPDIILLGGDITDLDTRIIEKKGEGDALRDLNAPLGVFTVYGNHEFYRGDPEETKSFFESKGITVLRDKSISFGNLSIIGRDDLMNDKRLSLEELTASEKIEAVDFDPANNFPFSENPFSILLDHRPDAINESVKQGINLQLSGHTHKGQFWPGTWLVRYFYPFYYGLYRFDSTDVIVSSGAGLWGPKFRIGSRSEIVVLNF